MWSDDMPGGQGTLLFMDGNKYVWWWCDDGGDGDGDGDDDGDDDDDDLRLQVCGFDERGAA